jgi:hypothetical protein
MFSYALSSRRLLLISTSLECYCSASHLILRSWDWWVVARAGCQHKPLESHQHTVVQPLYRSTQLNHGTKPRLELMIPETIRFVGQLCPEHLISTEYIVQACTSCCLLEAAECVSSGLRRLPWCRIILLAHSTCETLHQSFQIFVWREMHGDE